SSLLVASPSAGFRLTITVRQPAEARPAAIASPSPLLPPVMIATRPVKSNNCIPGNFMLRFMIVLKICCSGFYQCFGLNVLYSLHMFIQIFNFPGLYPALGSMPEPGNCAGMNRCCRVAPLAADISKDGGND